MTCPASVSGRCLEEKTGWHRCDGVCLWETVVPDGWRLYGRATLENEPIELTKPIHLAAQSSDTRQTHYGPIRDSQAIAVAPIEETEANVAAGS